MSGINDEGKNDAGTCGPGCNCGSAGVGNRSKWIIFGVVAVAAIGVTLARVNNTKDAEQPKKGFVLPTASTNPVSPVLASGGAAWAVSLKSMEELNVVATNAEAVFVVVATDDATRMAAIQQEVTAACATITGRGTKIGLYLLNKEAADYKGVAGQVGAPAVLAMVSGKGMSVVADKDVTKDAILKAFVGASRPRTGCGPSGCGPSVCN
jgi:hypothetical protein